MQLKTFHHRASTTDQAIADSPHLLITAGVHGDEYEPMLAVQSLVSQFKERLARGSVTLVPVVNENALTRRSRTADDGFDLARTLPGREDGSVTERTAHALNRLIQSADYYIDLHTGGALYNILPLAGYMLHADAKILAAQRAMAKAFGLPIVWGTTSRLEGRSLSAARDHRVPAIYVEYGGGGFCADAVPALVDGCLNVAAYLGMIPSASSTDRTKYFVEDDRDESGHLQIQHPAPMAGLFYPGARLGDTLNAGDLLGQVVCPLRDTQMPVSVQSDGVLLFVRVLSPVLEGDGLGGVLPVSRS